LRSSSPFVGWLLRIDRRTARLLKEAEDAREVHESIERKADASLKESAETKERPSRGPRRAQADKRQTLIYPHFGGPPAAQWGEQTGCDDPRDLGSGRGL